LKAQTPSYNFNGKKVLLNPTLTG